MAPEKVFAWAKRSVVVQQLFFFVIYSLVTFMLVEPTICHEAMPFENMLFFSLPFLHSTLLFLCALFSLLNKQSVWIKYLLSSFLLFVLGITTVYVGALADFFYKICI